LQLTRFVLEKFPRTRVIILTGYDEFEYAQQAVKLKAYDYILKPITASELRKILDKVKRDLDSEAAKMEDINKIKMQLRESLPLLKERFLNRLVSGLMQKEKVNEKLEYFGIRFEGNCFVTLVIDVDDFREFSRYHPGTEDELLLFAVYNISEEFVNKESCGVVFQNNNEKTVAVLCGENMELIRETAVWISEQIRQAIEKYLMFTVSIGVGAVCDSLDDIKNSYKGAVSALDYRFLLGKNRVISISDMEGHGNPPSDYNKEWERKLVSGIKTGTNGEIDCIIGNIVESLKNSYTSIERCYIHIQQVVVSIIDAVSELGISEHDVFGSGRSPLTEVYGFKTLEEVEAWLGSLCRRVSGFISDRRDNYCKIQALEAQEYIKRNYMDENISLNSVCKHLLISTSYFSMIFKNYTGETFIEYLTGVRIEKAMELLKTSNLKTYEIAHRVGYSDPHYFSLIFKKAAGQTPTEYRDKR